MITNLGQVMKVYSSQELPLPVPVGYVQSGIILFVAKITSFVIDFARGKQRSAVSCAPPPTVLQVYITCDKGNPEMFCHLHDKHVLSNI
jgi:hypothetical protein